MLFRSRQYAKGYRNLVALVINPRTDDLWGVQHGRDMLFENWPQFFTQEEDAALPSINRSPPLVHTGRRMGCTSTTGDNFHDDIAMAIRFG